MEIKNLPISNRLKMNAAMIKNCGVLADVGCDHAYSSIYLVGNGAAEHSIAMDVNQGPLVRAAENIRLYGLEDKIETRQSDGLEKLLPGEADAILISGMGGPLMQEILERGAACVQAAKQLVLQPQSELAQFRDYLHNKGFVITDEEMCCEDGKYYVVMSGRVAEKYASGREAEITAASAQGKELLDESAGQILGRSIPKELIKAFGVTKAAELVLHYGPCLLAKKHPVLRDFLMYEYEKKKCLVENLQRQQTERSLIRSAELEIEVEEQRKLLDYLGI